MVKKGGLLIFGGLVALCAINCAPAPTQKQLIGKVRGGPSLQLTDGSTISQSDSDEYNPSIVKLSDNYLVLVFGSNRSCQEGCLNHNVFMAKSATPYTGGALPQFNAPVVVTQSMSPWNETDKITFAAKASGSDIVLYAFRPSFNSICKGTYSNFTTPDASTDAIANSSRASDSIVGITADGSNIITADSSQTTYLTDPDSSTANPINELMMVESATQVRSENSGYTDSYMGIQFGSSIAAADGMVLGPILSLDISAATSGLFLSTLNTFYTSDAANDMVLFTANDGVSDDMYVITSHTAEQLWELAGFIGGDFGGGGGPSVPPPDHWYSFDPPGGCGDDMMATWTGTCSGITPAMTSFNGSYYAPFDGTTSYLDLGSQTIGTAFTIGAWVYVTGSGTQTIVANSNSGGTTAGFRFYVDASGMLTLETGNGSSGQTAATAASAVTTNYWTHVAVVVDSSIPSAMIYVNGAYVGTSTNLQTGFTATANIYIGKMADSTNYFQGQMDNVVIYNSALTAAQMALLPSAVP